MELTIILGFSFVWKLGSRCLVKRAPGAVKIISGTEDFLNDAADMPNLNKLNDTCVPEKDIPNEKIMTEVQSALHITNTDISKIFSRI